MREVAQVTADRALAKRLGCAVGKGWLRISSVRLDADRLPMGWTDVYVDLAFKDIGTVVRKEPAALISSLIESRYGRRIAAIRQGLGKLIPASLAHPLEAKADSAGLEIIRRYDDSAGDTIEISVSLHPADRFTVVTRLTREQP